MLEPQSRAALTEQLRPPTGYELSHAVGTTFTLDLATALSIPLSFASHRLAADADTLGVLDAIRRAADRVDVFAQAGEISMGARSDLVAFLEPMIHPVARRNGLFHPKVWFLEFRDGERTAYRFLCASRNLTADRSWDVIVRLDGAPAPAERAEAAAETNRPLADLLLALPTLGVHALAAERRSRIERFAERWRRVEWERPDAMRSIRFHVFGLGAGPLPDFRGQRAFIVSPFLSDDGLRILRAGVRTETHLLSRVESLDRLRPESIDAALTTYVLDDAATYSFEDESAPGQAAPVPSGDRLVGLHAKALVVDRADGAHVFLGSANATGAALHNNIEVMTEFVGPVPKVGVKATLDALGELKEEYPATGGAQPSEKEEAERRLEDFLRRLARARFSARVLSSDAYSLRVWSDDVSELGRLLDDTTSVRWSLLTRPDLGGTAASLSEPDGELIADIPLADITPFLVLIARDKHGNERRTIVVARLLDDVESRRDAVIARQLTDRAAFVRLLTLLLELAGFSMLPLHGSGGPAFFGTTAADTGTGLFEALVRALGERHTGLTDARRIIDYLREYGEDSILPEGFEELWHQVWAAHRELTGQEA